MRGREREKGVMGGGGVVVMHYLTCGDATPSPSLCSKAMSVETV